MQECLEAPQTLRGLSILSKILRTLHARASGHAALLEHLRGACSHLNILFFDLYFPHSLWVLVFDVVARTPNVCSSVAQTFWTRSCWFKNRALARDILEKIYVFHRSSIKNIQAIAFKELLLGGSNTELVALVIFENRALARDILKIWRFLDSMNYQKLRPRARQFDFLRLDHVCIFKNGALETSSKFHRFIFIKIDQNRAPVQSIRKI